MSQGLLENRSNLQRFLDVMSGQGRGAGPGALRLAASAASVAYGLAIRGRNRLYDWRLLPIRALGRPVISVGNLSAGGTGKTVLAAEIARWILRAGHRPAVLLRGYKGDSARGGSDEAALLRELLPGVVVEADPNRYAAGRRLLASQASVSRAVPGPGESAGGKALGQADGGPDAFILDDGFQHRRLHRDLDIVAIDATMDLAGPLGRMLPRGLLREPVDSLRRADCIVLTRVDQATVAQTERLLNLLAGLGFDTGSGGNPADEPPRGKSRRPVLSCCHAVKGLRLGGQDRPISDLAGRRYLAFCGIGNPAAFGRTLSGLPGQCLELVTFDDHHAYREQDLAGLVARARHVGADALVTTRKDQVKLNVAALPPDPPTAAEGSSARVFAGPPAPEAAAKTQAARLALFAVHVELEWLGDPAGQPLRGLVLDLLNDTR